MSRTVDKFLQHMIAQDSTVLGANQQAPLEVRFAHVMHRIAKMTGKNLNEAGRPDPNLLLTVKQWSDLKQLFEHCRELNDEARHNSVAI